MRSIWLFSLLTRTFLVSGDPWTRVYLKHLLVFSLASFVKYLGCYGIAEIPDRSSVGASLLLPVRNKDKDSWNNEENRKLLNGNSVDPMDRVCRSFESRFGWLLGMMYFADRCSRYFEIMQRQRNGMNGKIMEDGLAVHSHSESAINGA